MRMPILTLLLCCVLSLPLLALGWGNSSPNSRSASSSPSTANAASEMANVFSGTTNGRRRFLKTAAMGGGVLASVGTFAPTTAAYAAEAPFTPPPHSLDNQVMLITGGTAGLGLESAKRLANGGATVVLTSRTPEKGRKAIDAVQQYLTQEHVVNDNVFAVPLDLDDLQSVRDFPRRLQQQTPVGDKANKQINVLMNNAGVMAIPERQLTKDGYERTFQSNHLGHFLLTSKLSQQQLLANDATIINVSSEGYKFAGKNGLELDNLNGEQNYGPWTSYGQSKLANILFTKELQKRADETDGRKQWTALSLHPGAVQTDLARNIIGEEKWQAMQTNGPSLTDSLLLNTLSYLVLPVEKGATTQVWLAATAAAEKQSAQTNSSIRLSSGGEFFVKCKPEPLWKTATDMDMAKRLWEVSENMVGESFDL